VLRRIGPYRIARLVGRGGLGVVYYALDERTTKPVALKLLNRPSEDSTAARRLAREFHALREIDHRNIVRVLDAGVHEDVPFLVMEYVDGLALRSWLDASFDDAEYSPRPPPAPRDESVSISQSNLPRDSSDSLDSAPAWLFGDGEPDSIPGVHPARLSSQPPEAARVALGPELLARLNRPARLLRLRDITAQLADGLAFIHARGLVHRDLKPSNILVAEGGCAKLVDFGLVKVRSREGNTTATGHVVGTWRYMSPEQARGEPVDGRSDLYALGSVLFEMLCGQPPFAHTQTAALLQAIVHRAPPTPESLNPEADPLLSKIAMRLLRKDPEDRFQTAEEVARRLRAGGRE
jgi:serine/threonine protein kinase